MMQPDLRLVPKPALHVSARLCGMVGLLRMNNDELTRHMSELAARNPLLDLTPGRRGGQDAYEAPVGAGEDSLYAHVLSQISMAFDDPPQLRIAHAFVEALEPSGWLGQPVASIAERAGVTVQQAEAVLARLQDFEPTGLFARDLAECLRLQLIEHGDWDEAAAAVVAHLGVMLEGGADALADAAGLAPGVVTETLAAIRACNPKPGAAFQPEDPSLARRPDIIVRKEARGWQIELDRSTLPRVDLVSTDNEADPTLAKLRRDARWLVNAVRLRNQMTLDVARAVIGHQVGFLENGTLGLKPLRRCDVAERLGVHESTVGRVATGLLVQTPIQMLELTRFFSRALGRKRGRNASRRRLKALLRDMIAAEDPDSPLTDQALAAMLCEREAKVSRRTVAKYRQALGIDGAPARADCRKSARAVTNLLV